MVAPIALSPPGSGGSTRWASRLLPLHDSEPCGDAAACFEWPAGSGTAPRRLLAIVDGLGHGAEAAQASDAALRTLAKQPALALPDLFSRLDSALMATRGAAVGLVRLDGPVLRHAGVGNTRVMRLRGQAMTRLPSQNGIVGGAMPTNLSVSEIDVQAGDWLLLFTDGLNERVQLPLRLPEWEREPATLCEHLLTHWRTEPDDAGVLVMQLGSA